jgi:hypothetical protein
MPISRFARRAAAVLLPSLALSALTLGCSCSQSVEKDPPRPVSAEIWLPVDDLDDCAAGKHFDRMAQLFAPGSEPSPETRRGYAKYRFHATNPSQSGDTATVVVSVKDRQTGNEVGEVTWTMKRVGSAWRLTAAPLPAE